MEPLEKTEHGVQMGIPVKKAKTDPWVPRAHKVSKVKEGVSTGLVLKGRQETLDRQDPMVYQVSRLLM